MDIENSLRILEEEFDKKCEIEFDIDNELQCEVYIIPENLMIKMILQVKNYSCKRKMNKVLINKTFKTTEETLTFLHNFFNTDGSIKYSKITDQIYNSDDELIYNNNLEIAKQTLINKVSECCVCNENNNVLTKCGHNLCRFCFSKMYKIEKCCRDNNHCINIEKKILCPVCKRDIYSCYY
jgi:hypothetical protein